MMSCRTESLFYKALEIPPEQRSKFLARECCDDNEIRGEIESLLSASLDSDMYFEEFSDRISRLNSHQNMPQPSENMQIGSWKLMSLLGRGGMGSVYLAERSDQQYKQQAALKILPFGADDSISRYRFKSERQILAQLNHENIARFIDGGMTDHGTPYFVMEYVKGVSVDRFCQSNDLNITQKLQLFLKICNAVQYAHSHLVVHRDLKPNNVLVNSNANIKLLDFGVAKILEGNQHDLELTKVAFCPLTLEYASPEMLKGEPVSITTDVYSLGVMLYELLTEKKPYKTNGSAADLLALFNKAPERPSARTKNKKIKKALQGDLDTIISKAIDSDPCSRYASVRYFSDDIERYLKGFPIQARPYNSIYHMGKFIRRHRTGSLATVVVLFSLSFFTYFSFRQMQEAQQQRDLAQYQQQRVQASNDFLNLLLEEIGPQGKALTLEELLDRGVSMLENQFDAKADFMGHMFFELSQAYNSLGKKNKMASLLQKAEGLAEKQADWDLLASVLCTQSDLNFKVNPDYSRDRYNAGLEAQNRLATPSIASIVSCDRALARILEGEGDANRALEVVEHSLSKLDKISDSTGTLHLSLINRRTILLYGLERRSDVLDSNLQLLKLMEESGRASTIGYMIAMQNRAILLATAGEIIESANIRRKILKSFKSFNGKKQLPDRFITNYADGLMRLARYDEALELYTKNIDKLRTQGNWFLVARHQSNIGKIFSFQGKYVEAEAEILAAKGEFNKSPISNQRQLHRVALSRITLLREQGKLDHAMAAVEDLLKSMNYPEQQRGFLLSQTLRQAGEISLKIDSLSEAKKYIKDFLETATQLARSPKNSADVGYAIVLLAKHQLRLNNNTAALDNLEEAVQILSKSAGATHPDTEEAAQLQLIARKALAHL